MRRDVLLTDLDIRILDGSMPPIAHEGAMRLGVELVTEIAVVDSNMVSAIERSSDSSDPLGGFQIDFGHLPFPYGRNLMTRARRRAARRKDRPYRRLQLSLELFEIFRHIDLFQNSIAPDDAVDRKRIKELVGKNAASKTLWKFFNPVDVIIL